MKKSPVILCMNYRALFLFLNHFFHDPIFVDNRPEAYPVNFFTEIYLPALSQESSWLSLDSKYGFTTIILDVNDNLPAVKKFIYRRLNDPHWKLSYQNNLAIVLTRNRNLE